MPSYDLLIQNGTVIDPAAALHARRDVAITSGAIAALEPSIPSSEAARIVDATGKLVLPGLIDLHAHVFRGLGDSADPERDCLARGTTTALDGGSAGARSFQAFDEYVISRARPRIRVWLNISSIGLIDTRVGELLNLNYVDVASAVRTAEANRQTIVGFKIRISGYVAGGTCLPALKLVFEAAEAAKLPVMVHIGESFEPLPDVLAYLRPGDVVTHSLTGRRHGILDYDGSIWPAVREGRRAGLHFDAAHGRMHFGFAVVRRALEQGFLPDTLSTDVTSITAADPTFHLPLLMSKLIALGVTLDQAAALVTSNAANYLDRVGAMDGSPVLGTLRPAAGGDVAILELLEGDFTLRDNEGQTIQARQRLRPWLTVRAGEVVEAPEAA
jgi:dihydroorotase